MLLPFEVTATSSRRTTFGVPDSKIKNENDQNEEQMNLQNEL